MARPKTFDIAHREEADALRATRHGGNMAGMVRVPAGAGPGSKPGRMTSITPEKRRMIVKALRDGGNHRMAAALSGIPYETLGNSLKTGKAALEYAYATGNELTPVAQFYLDVEKAKADYQAGLITRYQKAMDSEPKVAMALLELLGRLHPEELGRRQVMKIEQDTTHRIEFVEKSGSDWQTGKVAGAVQKALPAGEADGVIDTEFSDDPVA